MAFDEKFSLVFVQALVANPAIHDGAILIGRQGDRDTYRILGWSYRLLPPPGPSSRSQPGVGLQQLPRYVEREND
jgi:hypothetical protein